MEPLPLSLTLCAGACIWNTYISFPFTNFNLHASFCVLKSRTEAFTAKYLRTTGVGRGTTGWQQMTNWREREWQAAAPLQVLSQHFEVTEENHEIMLAYRMFLPQFLHWKLPNTRNVANLTAVFFTLNPFSEKWNSISYSRTSLLTPQELLCLNTPWASRTRH